MYNTKSCKAMTEGMYDGRPDVFIIVQPAFYKIR